jgi:hypothetical protein
MFPRVLTPNTAVINAQRYAIACPSRLFFSRLYQPKFFINRNPLLPGAKKNHEFVIVESGRELILWDFVCLNFSFTTTAPNNY